jgi:hypothetical protein
MNGLSLVIVLVITSAVLFNMILLSTWCIIRRRRAQMKQDLIKNAYAAANPKVSRWSVKPAALWESASTAEMALLPLSPAKLNSPLKGSVTLSTAYTPQDRQSFPFVASIDGISNAESPLTSTQQISTRVLPAMENPFLNSPSSPSSTSTHESASRQRSNDPLTQSVTPNTRNRSPPSASFGHGGRMLFTSPFPEIREALAPETYSKSRRQNRPNPDATSSTRAERSHYRTTSESILRTPAPYYPKHIRALASNGSANIISSRDSLPLSAVGSDRPRETSLHHSLSLPLSPSRAAASSSRRRGLPTH